MRNGLQSDREYATPDLVRSTVGPTKSYYRVYSPFHSLANVHTVQCSLQLMNVYRYVETLCYTFSTFFRYDLRCISYLRRYFTGNHRVFPSGTVTGPIGQVIECVSIAYNQYFTVTVGRPQYFSRFNFIFTCETH